MLLFIQNCYWMIGKNLFMFLVVLLTCFQLIATQDTLKKIIGKQNDEITDIPQNMSEKCVCSWGGWMNSSTPGETGEDETYASLRVRGYKFCELPVNIQCYNFATKSEDIGFSTVCNKDLGLSCSLLCDDYAVRVACCYCPPDALGPEFQIISSRDSGGCLRALPSGSPYASSSIIVEENCDLNDPAQMWVWVGKNTLMNIETQQCLAFSDNVVVLEACDLSDKAQKWKYSTRSGPTALKHYSIRKYMKIQGRTVVVDSPRGSASKWLARIRKGIKSLNGVRSFKDSDHSSSRNESMSCTLEDGMFENIDDAEKFAISLLDTLRRLPLQKFQLAKMKIHEVLYDIEYNEIRSP